MGKSGVVIPLRQVFHDPDKYPVVKAVHPKVDVLEASFRFAVALPHVRGQRGLLPLLDRVAVRPERGGVLKPMVQEDLLHHCRLGPLAKAGHPCKDFHDDLMHLLPPWGIAPVRAALLHRRVKRRCNLPYADIWQNPAAPPHVYCRPLCLYERNFNRVFHCWNQARWGYGYK